MIKVCFFMNSPFTMGGEQRVTRILANYLSSIDNYKVYFLLDSTERITNSKLLNSNIEIIYLNEMNYINRLKTKIFNKISMLNSKTGIIKNNKYLLSKTYCIKSREEEIANIINNYNFDYVIGVASKYFGILSIIKNRINSNIIAWEHSCFKAYFETKGRRFYNQNAFINDLFSKIDNYVVQTKDDYKQIKNKYNYKTIVINNPNTFNLKNGTSSKLNNKIFLAIGRMDKVKGYDILIKSFKIFHEQNNEWKLYLVGDGKMLKHYKKMVSKYNLNDYVIFEGNQNDVSKYYLNSSIYMMTSLWEGWGMVVTEAMQYGLPVISNNLPCVHEIFEKEYCGIIVEKGTPTFYAEAMISLVKNGIYKTMRRNCQNRAKNFDISIIGKKWKSILK